MGDDGKILHARKYRIVPIRGSDKISGPPMDLCDANWWV